MNNLLQKVGCFAIVVLGLASCAGGPSNWANTLSERAYCDMPIDEIEKVVKRKVVEQKTANSTHFIGDEGETTVAMLSVEQNKLKRVEIAWTSKAIAVVPEQIKTIDLCNGRKIEIRSTYAQPAKTEQKVPGTK